MLRSPLATTVPISEAFPEPVSSSAATGVAA